MISPTPYAQCPMWTPLYLHRRALYHFIRKIVPQLFSQCAASLRQDKFKVLDVGCGHMPYRPLFLEDARCAAYDGADVEAFPDSNVVAVIDPATQDIALANATYDLVVHFQTLEHVPNPHKFLAECHRVLRPGGMMFCTVPFLFEYHGVPRDFYRWTFEGIAQDLAKAGLEPVSVVPVETDWQSILTVLESFLARKWGYFFTKPLFLALNLLSLPSRQDHTSRCPLTLAVVAKKAP